MASMILALRIYPINPNKVLFWGGLQDSDGYLGVMRYRNRHDFMLGPNERSFSQLPELIHKVPTFSGVLGFDFLDITDVDESTINGSLVQ